MRLSQIFSPGKDTILSIEPELLSQIMKLKQTSLLRYDPNKDNSPNDFEIVDQDDFQDIEAMTLRERVCSISISSVRARNIPANLSVWNFSFS